MKYKIRLNLDVSGEVIVEAKNPEEARSIGEKMIEKYLPGWFEWGDECVDEIHRINPKKK